MTTSRFTGQVVPPGGKQLTHIVRVSVSFILIFNNLKQDITKIEMLPIKGNNLALSGNNQFN